MKIGAIAVMPYDGAFLGIQCKKGRGIILPGGTYDPAQDRSFHLTACREAFEECGAKINFPTMPVTEIACWPDGGDYMTFSFWCPQWDGPVWETNEGKPVRATWMDLIASKFGAYYLLLNQKMQGKYSYER